MSAEAEELYSLLVPLADAQYGTASSFAARLYETSEGQSGTGRHSSHVSHVSHWQPASSTSPKTANRDIDRVALDIPTPPFRGQTRLRGPLA